MISAIEVFPEGKGREGNVPEQPLATSLPLQSPAVVLNNVPTTAFELVPVTLKASKELNIAMVQLEDSLDTAVKDIGAFIVTMPNGEKIGSDEVMLAKPVEVRPTKPLKL